MQKLLKYWKVLSFGVVAAAFGLMMASCAETGDEETTPAPSKYEVTIYYGSGYLSAEDGRQFIVLDDGLPALNDATGDGSYEKNAFVDLYPGSDPAGSSFYKWTWSPETLDAEEYEDTLSFEMPGSAVKATAWFLYKTPEVRYTWETAQEPNIYLISASEEDVASWYSDVYEDIYLAGLETDDPDEILLYVSHIPWYDGAKVPNNIFPTLNDTDPSRKSVYYKVNPDYYTAICTAIDPILKDTFDIVANYYIEAGTAKPYFEVGFDVGLFVDPTLDPNYDPNDDPDPDLWVLLDKFDTKVTAPNLNKTKNSKAVKLLKKIKKDNVTYYVLKRPKNK